MKYSDLWFSQIANSQYSEILFTNNIVPVLTDYTWDGGEAICNHGNTSTDEAYWHAFDKNTDTLASNISGYAWDTYYGVHFNNAVVLSKVSFMNRCQYNQDASIVKVQYSDDGITWLDATDQVNIDNPSNLIMHDVSISSNKGKHKYWVLRSIKTNASDDSNHWVVRRIDFYGR